jgi:hypothetical protein
MIQSREARDGSGRGTRQRRLVKRRAQRGGRDLAGPLGLRITWPRTVLATLAALGLIGFPAPNQPVVAKDGRRSAPPPVVIAVVEGGGVNVLHSDFRLPPGIRIGKPSDLPRRTMVRLPRNGSFEQRTKEVLRGPLGDLEPGKFYGIHESRLLGVYVSPGAGRADVFEDSFHATGTTSAAAGLQHGTNPTAWLVYVMGTDRAAWEWVAEQDWIDIVSTSYYTIVRGDGGPPETCPAREWIRKITDRGGVVFSAAGNVESTGVVFAPSGVPEAYQVGGVDDAGRTYLPARGGTDGAVTPTRPYETGDRFDFPAADSASLDGSMDFGGTSGATPSTAGRAAELVQFARGILGSRSTGIKAGALAVAGSNTLSLPQRGPLSDGRLENEELLRLLRHVAIPAEPVDVGRYLVEGYGALNEKAIANAKRVLAGKIAEPERPQEDTVHDAVETARDLFYPGARCS